MGFFENIVRYLFYIIDSLVYWINTILFELFTLISKSTFASDLFDVFFNRVYAILGIVILFRIAFSLIQMMINPDLLNDKQKSPGKLAMRVVVSLMLIIAVPSIFTFAYEVQSAVLDENILGKIVLGPSADGAENNASDENIQTAGKQMAWKVYRGFLNIDSYFLNEETGELNSDASQQVKNCLRDLNSADSANNPFDEINKSDCLNYKEDDIYVYDYKWIVSTIATGMVAWILIGFCLDVGVRVVKLGFLQLIAPIPISSYVLGNKDSAFNNWVKASIMTYLEVFIRLIIIYFIIFMVSAIFNTSLNIPTDNVIMKSLVKVVIALGLLVFAKEAPNLLKDMFGIKGDSSSFSLNPMSRLNSSPLAKMAIGGAVTGVAAGAGNIGRRLMDSKKTFNDLKANGSGGFGAFTKTAGGVLASGLGGMFGGALAGGKAGFGKDAKIGSAINKGLVESRAHRDLRDDRKSIGYGFGTRMADNLRGMAGIDSKAKERAGAAERRYQSLQSNQAVLRDRASEFAKNINSQKFAEMSQYTYDSKVKSWHDADGNAIDENVMYSSLGINVNATAPAHMPTREDFTDSQGVFHQSAYEAELDVYNRELEEYSKLEYMKAMKQYEEIGGQAFAVGKERDKYKTEQNRVEGKKSSS